ncbi:MAG: GerMN domain-containing protein, partial [Oscillospiraceae bacterium]|nr:GerMN domain-containing protein [Oscillospiraceae bacterium]
GLVLGAGCTAPAIQSAAPPEGEYELWFVSSARSQDGESWGTPDSGALGREFRPLTRENEPVEDLLSLLLAGPERKELTSPFPRGTTLRSWRLEEGRVTLDLSEAYSGLAGVELTMADGCIVLTLCQLEEVEEVYITVEGRRRPFRDRVYTRQDFVENNRFDLLPDVETEAFADESEEGEALDLESSAMPRE